MNSHAWMNGQHRQVRHNSQKAATQLTLDKIWNQQDGTANNSCQYRTLNTSVQPSRSDDLIFRNGVHSNRQISNWQTSAFPHKTVSSQMPVGGGTNINYLKALQGNLKNSFTNTQSGNPGLLVTNGHRVATQQDFHPNSGVISSSTLCPPNMMKANTTYHQQDMSSHWNQQIKAQWKQSIRTQDPNVVSHPQNCRLLIGLLQNANGELNEPISAYTTTATSLLHEQEAYTGPLVSATAHNGQTAHNQNHRITGTQHGIHLTPPPSYHGSVSQSFRNKNITTNSSSTQHTYSSSTQHTWQFSSANVKKSPQQNPVNLNTTYNIREDATWRVMSETNELNLNPAADTHGQMLSQQRIARIAEDLQKSFTATSDMNPSALIYLPRRQNQLVREVRMRESNQNMQPVTLTVTEGYNSNSSQSLPVNSGLSWPKITHSVVTRTQNSVNAPQQSSVPNVYVTTTGDGSGNGSNVDNTLFSKSDRVSKGNLVGSLSGASQLMKMPESISPQKNDSSIHSSPGRTGTRAIAVVQPLSQESYQVGSKNTPSKMTNQLTDPTATNESSRDQSVYSSAVAKDTNTCLQGEPNQLRSTKSKISHSTASNDSTLVSSSNSAEDQALSQKQLCADDTGSKLTVNMQVDNQVTPTAQQSVTSEVPINQSSHEDKSENPTDPKAQAFDLSSIPTIPWTAVTLNKLIVPAEKAQMELSKDATMRDYQSILLNMFWEGNLKTLECKVKTSWYRDLITNIREFCSKHITSHTAILSQVKDSFKDQLKSYYVLKDNEVYTEQPYKSSWLNVNEQLDDIDKEFGFSWSLKHCLYIPKGHSQSVEVETVNSVHEQTAHEFSNKVLSQRELEPIDSGKEKQAFTVEATSTQAVSPNETESVDSSDPYYTFEIQVLPPEEAKLIFEQVQTNMPKSTDIDSHLERIINTSVEGEISNVKDVALNDSEQENTSVCSLEQVCCISRLMEMFGGQNTPSSKCQCRNEQSLKDCTDNTLTKEDTAVEKEDKLCANTCDSKFDMEGENHTEGRENIDYQIKTYSWLELCDELSQTNALTENDHKPNLFSDKESKNISQINLNNSQSSILVISDDKDDLSSSDTEIQAGLEVDCVQDQTKSTRSTLSCTSFSSDKENENPRSSESELASQMPDPEDDCEKTQLKPKNVAESSLETEEQTKISVTPAFKTPLSLSGKHETDEKVSENQSIYNRIVPFNTKSNKGKKNDENSQPSTWRKVLIVSTECEPLASNVRAVQLVPFGSVPEDKSDLTGSRRHISSQGAGSDGVPQPPKVVSVKLSPLKRKSNETVTLEEYSVKQRIHEKWRKSYPPAKIKHRNKLKTQKCTFASLSVMSPKKAETVVPKKTEKPTASSEMRICNQSTKRCLSLKRRRSLSDGPKGREEKKRKDAVTLKQPSGQKLSNAENGSLAETSFQEKIVLRFSVLPSTFNFKDRSNDRNNANDPVPNKPALVEGKGESVNKTIAREKGTWYPEKRYCPLSCPPVPKKSTLFHQFQKKYKEMTQTSMDK